MGKKVVKVAERLLQSGFKLHIDDFGSGYSSMESLSRLPFSVLKIDKSLIDHICENEGRNSCESYNKNYQKT